MAKMDTEMEVDCNQQFSKFVTELVNVISAVTWITFKTFQISTHHQLNWQQDIKSEKL